MMVLGESGQRLQVRILTCHPKRSRGLVWANFVDLEALVRGVGSWLRTPTGGLWQDDLLFDSCSEGKRITPLSTKGKVGRKRY